MDQIFIFDRRWVYLKTIRYWAHPHEKGQVTSYWDPYQQLNLYCVFKKWKGNTENERVSGDLGGPTFAILFGTGLQYERYNPFLTLSPILSLAVNPLLDTSAIQP